jgi:hypothetical protein
MRTQYTIIVEYLSSIQESALIIIDESTREGDHVSAYQVITFRELASDLEHHPLYNTGMPFCVNEMPAYVKVSGDLTRDLMAHIHYSRVEEVRYVARDYAARGLIKHEDALKYSLCSLKHWATNEQLVMHILFGILCDKKLIKI